MNPLLELIRAPAAVTVVGDTLVGLAAARRDVPDAPAAGRADWLLPVSSVLLYSAGMALNDYADRELDAVERPERPIPSGRVSARRALALAGALTLAGVAVAGAADRRALRLTVPLVASIWTYDLIAKDGPAGPLVMGSCRALDVLMGAAGTPGGLRRAIGPAAAIGTHTLAVTVLSRGEVHGTLRAVPVTTTTVSAATATVAVSRAAAATARSGRRSPGLALVAAALAVFGATTLRAGAHAALDPAPATVRAAVRAGIGGLIPLQSALLAGAGRPGPAAGLLVAGLATRLLGHRAKGDIT